MAEFWFTAALWIGLALLASLISVRTAIAVALIEIILGALAGNAAGIKPTAWIDVLASIGVVLVVFLAGAELDVRSFRGKSFPTLSLGTAAFLVPLVTAAAVAHYLLGWLWPAALIAALATSTTSVVVVYAVTVETGLARVSLGQMLLAACFLTNVGAMVLLGILFTEPDPMVLAIAAALVATFLLGPKIAHVLFKDAKQGSSEPEIRFVLLTIFLLGGIGALANINAVLPAFLAGVALASYLAARPTTAQRLRTVSFAAFAPFFFLKAGTLFDASTFVQGGTVVLILLATRLVAKFAGVLTVTGYLRYPTRMVWFTALVMSTGLTFDIVIALFGLDNGIIDSSQYSVLVAVAIISVIGPTMIAQTWFRPQFNTDTERPQVRP